MYVLKKDLVNKYAKPLTQAMWGKYLQQKRVNGCSLVTSWMIQSWISFGLGVMLTVFFETVKL